jgi:hypothetical protein
MLGKQFKLAVKEDSTLSHRNLSEYLLVVDFLTAMFLSGKTSSVLLGYLNGLKCSLQCYFMCNNHKCQYET